MGLVYTEVTDTSVSTSPPRVSGPGNRSYPCRDYPVGWRSRQTP